MRKPISLGRAWEQGIVRGPDRQVLFQNLGRSGTESQPVQFQSHARVLPIHLESLTRQSVYENGMVFDLTGTAKVDEYTYWVEGWYSAETGLGHLILRPIYKV